ncbi:MAG: TonB-dependent receptor, partial [Arenimonas sp.]|nr:TonB-dependent receptor [Arenimonas sp.]
VWDYSAYGIEGETVKVKNSWSNWSPRFVIDYAVSDDVMIWGSYTQGYKAGGFNSTEINSAFDNEDVVNYEIGMKADFPDQRLSVNSSLFSYLYKDKQSIFLDPNTDSGIPQYVTSTSDVEAWGWDLQVYWNPVENLAFSLNSQYIDQTYKDFVTSGGTDLSGQATGLPEWSTTVGGSYTWVFGDNSSLEFSLLYAYMSAVTCNDDSQTQGTCQVSTSFDVGTATNRTDARLQWTSAEGRWGLGIYGKNLSDNQYVNGVNNITAPLLGTPFASISEPRQYGIEGRLNF